MVRLASLIVLLATLYILIQCTQQITEGTEDSSSGTTTCTFSNTLIGDNLNNVTFDLFDIEDCPIVSQSLSLSLHM